MSHAVDGLVASQHWRNNIAYAMRNLGRAGSCEARCVPSDPVGDKADLLLWLHESR